MIVCSQRLGLTALFTLALLSGCASLTPSGGPGLAAGKLPRDAAIAAAVFGPEKRLWRLILTNGRLYVDTSGDHGATYTKPVAVNARPEPILAQAEDRPLIAVDGQGRIYVLYAAGTPGAATSHFASSTDGGRSFSTPMPVSNPTVHAGHTQDAMVVSPSGQVYVFWNDERGKDQAFTESQGASLYYATIRGPSRASWPNQEIIKDGMCNCCRLAVDLDLDGLPVVLARFVYPGQVRDHGMLKVSPEGLLGEPWRVTEDDWRIEACPMHGPAVSIASDGRYHIAWFTQGSRRGGLFYAHSDDLGKHFSTPMAFGEIGKQPAHADVLALGKRVILVWKEFDGRQTRLIAMQARDRGETWSTPTVIAQTSSAADYPFLINDGQAIFISWHSVEHGYQLIALP